MNVFIIANGPGELMGWVRPVVKRLRERQPNIEIILIIPPCQYASGKETVIAKNFSEINYIMKPMDYIKYIFLGKSFSFISQAKGECGVCVFLGGDPFHTILISRRVKLPAVGYLQKPRWNKRFKKFMVLNDKIRKENFLQQGIKSDKVTVVGDLMVDAVKDQIQDEKISNYSYFFSGKPVVSILPGSRPNIAYNMALFFLGVCELIKEKFFQAQFFLILSPFIKKEQLIDLNKTKVNKIFNVPKAKLVEENKQWKLITSSGLKVAVITEKQYHIMSLSDLAITIPGTNTAELAYFGIPMIVVVPLNRPEVIPLNGFTGLTGKLPFLGELIKREAIKKYNKKIRFCAIPNIRAEKEIVPEVRGKIQPQDVAEKAVKLLQNKKRLISISGELKKAMEKDGAANKVVDVILQVGKGEEN